MINIWNWLGAYRWCWPSMLLALIPGVLGNIFDNKLCFLFAGICIGIAIHQWMVAYAMSCLSSGKNREQAQNW